MRWVADASSVAAYLLGEGSDSEREAILADVHAPDLLDVEVTQTLRGLVRGGKVELTAAEHALVALAELAVHRHPDLPLLRRAWAIRDVCTTYDGLYVALAEALDASLLTRDARLARGIRPLVDVVLVG